MGYYTFHVSRTLISEIIVEADSLAEAKALAKDEVEHMGNSDFSDREDQSIELLKAPTEEEEFAGQGIEIF